MPERADVVALWDRQANVYDGAFDGTSGDGHALVARLRKTIELAGSGPGDSLDAGMGPGRLCAELARRKWTVHGVDSSREMVALARARIPEAAARLVEGSIEALPFPDASFDLVTATGVLEYAEVSTALDELARVLKPGGLAIVSYPNPYSLYGGWRSRVWYPAVRGAKRSLRRPGARFPRGSGRIAPTAVLELLSKASLVPLQAAPVSCLLLPTPLDILAPRFAARVGARLEAKAHSRLVRRAIATQIVYSARKDPARAAD